MHVDPLLPADRDWLRRLAHLRLDRATHDPAPHKPLLLLCVLDLAEEHCLSGPRLALTPELAFRFFSYWKIVANRRPTRPDIRMPFHHLQSGGFWQPLDEQGNTSPDKRLTRCVEFDPDFLRFANSAACRDQARRVLVRTYFRPSEQLALQTLLGLPVTEDDESEAASEGPSPLEAKQRGRDARFRLTVVPAYHYTCALTGFRLTTIAGGTIVDAAHIHRFSDSRNNDPKNGIALCKNAHWLFDNGLWSIDDEYNVLVASKAFDEASPDQKSLGSYHGQRIRLPDNAGLWPDKTHLSWHRTKKFVGLS